MNVKLKILRKVLEEAINNIDAGNSNHKEKYIIMIVLKMYLINMFVI